MSKKPKHKKGRKSKHAKLDLPGISLERAVARVQQMMDPASKVTHNETLQDRVGNWRQFDVVIRGNFGGRPALGVMECKDHSRKKGPADIEAFAKKTDNLGANLRVMVSSKGFTEQALRLARHEFIGCLSLLQSDSGQVGFSIGDAWYGVLRKWTDARLHVLPAAGTVLVPPFPSEAVTLQGRPVTDWFLRRLMTSLKDVQEPCRQFIHVSFAAGGLPVEINGQECDVARLSCEAIRVCKNKKKWVVWTGDAFYDWHDNLLKLPAGATLVSSPVETSIAVWDDYGGEVPDPSTFQAPGLMTFIVHDFQEWDGREVVDLEALGQVTEERFPLPL